MAFVIEAYGAWFKGEAEAGAAEYNATLARQNEAIALSQGAAAVEAQQRDFRRKQGKAIAAYGAAGVDPGAGSPLDVLAESARAATLDALTIQYNYTLKGRGYANQAALSDANASNARTAGYIAATSAVVNGASQAAAGGGTAIPMFG